MAAVTNTAFGTFRGDPEGQRFPGLLFETGLAADPAGCFVAVAADDPAAITGPVFSVARSGLGWFGPLAVHPGAQRGGVGRELTAACLESWSRRAPQPRGGMYLVLHPGLWLVAGHHGRPGRPADTALVGPGPG